MADDGSIQVPPDSTGSKVDTSEIAREVTQEIVQRQRMEAYDDDGNAISSVAIVEQLKETNQLLLQLIMLLEAKEFS